MTVTLDDVAPRVWRRVEVPSTYTFYDLHVAIQDAMGWQDYHLHEFEIVDPASGERVRLGIPDDEGFDEEPPEASWEVQLAPFVGPSGARAVYRYDFGDGWEHRLEIAPMQSAEPGVGYPRCIAGARRCPPEDCGGPMGFAEFLKAIGDPSHPEHEAMLAWVGGPYDPATFDAAAVRFEDPRRRFRRARLG